MNVKNNKVFDIKGGRDAEGQTVWVWKRHNGSNQRWNVVYVDKAPKLDVKKYAKAFGFEFLNKPFFIVSRMHMRRVAETNSSNVTLRNLRRTYLR